MEVWRARVEASGELARLLSSDEVERAARFRFERDCDAFVTARGVARTLIGRRLGVPAEDVVFGSGPNGKPEVEGVSFNVSHAGEWVMVGVAAAGRVGVDVEQMRPGVEMRSLARRFFTPAENEALARLSGDELVRGFYGCWTQKEAFVKAVGEGLSFALDRVEVAVHPAVPRIVSVDGRPNDVWTLAEVDCGPGYASAAVIDRPGAEVVVHDWPASVAA